MGCLVKNVAAVIVCTRAYVFLSGWELFCGRTTMTHRFPAPFVVVWAFLVLPIFAQAQSPQQTDPAAVMETLHWINGPTKVKISENSTFDVPQGLVFLNPTDTKTMMELMHNPSSGQEYLFAPENFSWFGLFEFTNSGYIKDDEKIDATAILNNIRLATDEANKERRARGWSTMKVIGWKYPPYYDVETRRLEWAIDGRDENTGPVINFNTRILGRHGVTSVVLITSPEKFDTQVREFKTALKNYSFNIGERYTEFKQGDRVAEYGLSALIIGGATAAAAKTGLLKSLWVFIVALVAGAWKIILVVIAVVLGWLGSLFKSKKKD